MKRQRIKIKRFARPLRKYPNQSMLDLDEHIRKFDGLNHLKSVNYTFQGVTV